MQSFIVELRRRNVLRVAAFYAAAGWLLVQVATQVLPFFDIPNWVVRAVVVAISIGFPAALVFAWFYELTPEGLKLESEIVRSESITRQTGRRLDRWIIGILGLAVVVLLANNLTAHRDTAPAAPAATAAGTPPVPPAPVVADQKSIAVLPFENLSDDKSNAYFAEGIQDEILTRLAKIGALKVISRTSTAHYASSPDNLPEIAHQLGVANILEGSVQKAGDMVHVNVQLIRAASDDHLWAESYDRKLDNVFGVEGEVAQTIATTLNATLSGAEKQAVTAQPTQNLAAYEAYLRGRAQMNRGFGYANWQQARDSLQEATRLDPQFALAWSWLTLVESYLYFNGIDTSEAARGAAQAAADTARRLAPDLGEAYSAHGAYRYYVEHDFAGALQELTEAHAREPNNALVLHVMALVGRRLGQWDAAIDNERKALELDPRNGNRCQVFALELLIPTNQFDEARAVADKGLQIDPASVELIATKAISYQSQGRMDQAQRLLDGIPLDVSSDISFMAQIQQMLYMRRDGEAIAALRQALDSKASVLSVVGPILEVLLGQAQSRAGDAAQARASFGRALQRLQAMQPLPVNDYQYPVVLALAYAGLGEREAALKAAHAAVEASRPDAADLPGAEAALAQVQAAFGDIEEPFAALPRLLKTPAGLTPALLRYDPAWDPLRKDARFARLAAESEAPTSAAGGR